jgi:predicted CopG family antitoxin
MASKNITIKSEVFEELSKKQKPGETLSDVLERLLGIKKEFTNLADFIGRWKDLPPDYLEIFHNAEQEIRQEINRRFD